MPTHRRAQFVLAQLGVALLALACGGHGGGGTGVGASRPASCSFSIVSNAISSKMATVGIVEWSTTLPNLASANIVYALNGAGASVLNNGGTAPVDLTKTSYRTLLLGLKPSSDYTFHIEATDVNGAVCKSSDYALPTTGVLPEAPTISRTASNPAAQAKGFIVTSSGLTYGNYAIIIDADGAVVWYAVSPIQCSRARMDYEGVNMWMVAVNEDNSTGEMRFVSMDGQTTMTDISGLSNAHHDFAALPGKIAAMTWATSDIDSESDLVEMNSDGSGSPATVFTIGSNLYVGASISGATSTDSYHCNSILYHSVDDSFTIGDRYPNLYVKVSHAGAIQWQFGGSCANAPAGASHCVSESWQVNHGHHLLDDGTMLLFNNNTGGSPSDVLEFKLNTAGTMTATSVKDFTSGSLTSNVLGDVQRLPNGNTLITYSTSGEILEVDPSWAPVQTLTGSYGYADWRQTLYGPPPR
jgi:Arylsulfotransferase (ASST)